MTTLPRELAVKRPANTPVRPAPRVVDGQFKTRRDSGRTIFVVLVLALIGLLFTGFVTSLVQQHL